ncbi:MAG: hypothetical protein V3V01_18055, partial [Acidimicrobiales bacterium]
MAERNLVVGAAVVAATGAILAGRRALRRLDAADANRPSDLAFRFPSGELRRVTTDDGASIAV